MSSHQLSQQYRSTMDRIQQLHISSKYAETIQLLEAQVARQHSGRAALLLGDALRHCDKHQQARCLNQKILLDKLASPIVKAEALYDCERVEEAIQLLDNLISSESDNAQAYHLRGRCYGAIGQQGKALNDLDRAICLCPGFTFAYASRGQVLGEMAEKGKAIEDYTKAISCNPTFAVGYLRRGALNQLLGNVTDSLEDYNKALSVNPRFAEAYKYRGNLFEELGDKQRAFDDYCRAIEINPNRAGFYVERADLNRRMGNKAGALADLNSALEHTPDDPLYLCRRADFYIAENYAEQLYVADLKKAKQSVEGNIFGAETSKKDKEWIKALIQSNCKLLDEAIHVSQSWIIPAEDKTACETVTKSLIRSNLELGPKQNSKSAKEMEELRRENQVLKKEQRNLMERMMRLQHMMEAQAELSEQLLRQFAPLYKRFQQELENDEALSKLKEQNSLQYEYTVTLARMLYNQCKAFELLNTRVFQSSNLNSSKRAKCVISIVSYVAGRVPLVGDYIERLFGIVEKAVDSCDQTKFKETQYKFEKLTGCFVDDSRLYSVVISSVIALTSHPCKQEEIRCIVSGTRKGPTQNTGVFKQVEQLVSHVLAGIDKIQQQIKKELLGLEIPKDALMKTLAAKDLATFLKFVFGSQPHKLRSLQQIIRQDLIDQEYLEQKPTVPQHPVSIMNLLSWINKDAKRYITLNNGDLELSADSNPSWKLVRKGEQEYQLSAKATSEQVTHNQGKVVVSTPGANCSGGWRVLEERFQNQVGWRIEPIDNPDLCLSFKTSGGWIFTEKSEVVLVSKTKERNRSKYLWKLNEQPC